MKRHLIVAANPTAYTSKSGMIVRELPVTSEAFAYHQDHFQKKLEPGVFHPASFKNNGLANFLIV